jgi:hypothetical protein
MRQGTEEWFVLTLYDQSMTDPKDIKYEKDFPPCWAHLKIATTLEQAHRAMSSIGRMLGVTLYYDSTTDAT